MTEDPKNFDPKDIEKMRESVLKWIEPKPSPVIVFQPPQPPKKVKPESSPEKKFELLKKLTRINFLSEKNQGSDSGGAKKYFYRFITFFAVAGLLIGGFQTYLMLFEPNNSATKIITRYLSFPAATVNYRIIPYYHWQKQSQQLQLFYEKLKKSDEAFALPDARQTKARTLERLIEEELIYQYFTKMGLVLTREEIEDEIVKLIVSFGGEEKFAVQLDEKYGWSLNDFNEIIFKPLLIKNKLSLFLLDHPQNQQAWLSAQEVLRQIRTQKNSFENLAQKYSQDSSAQSGGDIGYLSLAELNPEIAELIKDLKPGDVSRIVKTSLGFHIFRLDEILTDDNDEISKVRLHQILIKSHDFSEFLKSFRQNSTIGVFLDY